MFQRLALMQTACQALGALCSDSSGSWLPLPGAERRPGNNLVLPRAPRTSGGSFQVVSAVLLHSQLIFGDISLAASELLTIPPFDSASRSTAPLVAPAAPRRWQRELPWIAAEEWSGHRFSRLHL